MTYEQERSTGNPQAVHAGKLCNYTYLRLLCGSRERKKDRTEKGFLSMPEEEAFKYFDIFKHTLSGTLGKNLMNMEFPTEQEMPGGTQEFLLKLRDSKLTDDLLVEEFYDKVIENYIYPENYYIILIHAVYDVPGKSSDGLEMFDASDTVYEHIMCSICPVNLTKAGLTYNAETNNIEDRIRDWFVELPVKGFLFPAFNDRASDLHGVLYYSRNQKSCSRTSLKMFSEARSHLPQKIRKHLSKRSSVTHWGKIVIMKL